MREYNPAEIEGKWQKIWEDTGVFHAQDDFTKPKFYGLIEFPYPSGAGLHVGHPRSNTALDIISRKRRMQGYNVLYPIGWDAFGLPTENYAIANNVHPAIVTERNVDWFRRQLQSLGFSFDYTREVNTTDPSYYHWTQWIFLQLFKHGLAYKTSMPINFCTNCKVGLANEEVVENHCERCGSPVVRKTKSQWMLRITDYAQKLLDGLETVDFLEKIKAQQVHWIGRSQGAEVDFRLAEYDENIRVFTTRPDTLFGATYMVLSPEHPLVQKYMDRLENAAEVRVYCREAAGKSDFDRTEMAAEKEKTGVRLVGLDAVNPVNGRVIPVFISDYVLVSYGTGAIMAVPGHDTRDWAFARKYGLPVIEVVAGGDVAKEAYTNTETGILVNSGFLDGMQVSEAKEAITCFLEEKGVGKATVNYKLRDWVFSRQRYWGEPIPLVWCGHCGEWVPLPEEALPLELPQVSEFKPGREGESPLAAVTDWVNTTCPRCGGAATRETDTMPQWAGSSWYFLRYIDPHNDQTLADPEKLKYWLPVDWYNGGMEHTTLHLLYSRFWHKFLYDIGAVPTPEPYAKRTSHGMILGEDGQKMSKSRGNVINPDDMVAQYGADAFRTYEMFMGAFDQPIPWSTNGVAGCRRFLERVWRLADCMTEETGYAPDTTALTHRTIRKVGEDYEAMKFNTAIAAMMEMTNALVSKCSVTRGEFSALLRLLNPVAPHITEELWAEKGFEGLLATAPWPEYVEELCAEATIEMAVQINGKVRARIIVPADADAKAIEAAALAEPTVQSLLEGKTVRKIIAIPKRICNIVIG
ncbi:MAG: leucine--tRNA ligase [Christensenellales bacterium]|jgi:leucyl-tRNA synthetase